MSERSEVVRDFLGLFTIVLLQIAAWVAVAFGFAVFVLMPRPMTSGGWLTMMAFPVAAIALCTTSILLWRRWR